MLNSQAGPRAATASYRSPHPQPEFTLASPHPPAQTPLPLSGCRSRGGPVERGPQCAGLGPQWDDRRVEVIATGFSLCSGAIEGCDHLRLHLPEVRRFVRRRSALCALLASRDCVAHWTARREKTRHLFTAMQHLLVGGPYNNWTHWTPLVPSLAPSAASYRKHAANAGNLTTRSYRNLPTLGVLRSQGMPLESAALRIRPSTRRRSSPRRTPSE